MRLLGCVIILLSGRILRQVQSARYTATVNEILHKQKADYLHLCYRRSGSGFPGRADGDLGGGRGHLHPGRCEGGQPPDHRGEQQQRHAEHRENSWQGPAAPDGQQIQQGQGEREGERRGGLTQAVVRSGHEREPGAALAQAPHAHLQPISA